MGTGDLMWFLLARLRYLTNGSTLLQAELELPSISIKPVGCNLVESCFTPKGPKIAQFGEKAGPLEFLPPINFVAAGQYLGVVEK